MSHGRKKKIKQPTDIRRMFLNLFTVKKKEMAEEFSGATLVQIIMSNRV